MLFLIWKKEYLKFFPIFLLALDDQSWNRSKVVVLDRWFLAWINICYFGCHGTILEDVKCFELILILKMHILRSMDGCFIVTQAPLATRSYQKKTPSNKYLNVKAGGWNGQCHSMRFSFECFLSLLGMENSAKCSYFTTEHFVSTLPKYSQPGLVIDAIINFAMSRNKSYYIIGKTYVKCKCLVFISIYLYTDLDFKVGIYKN